MDRRDSLGFTIRSLSNLMRRKMIDLAHPPQTDCLSEIRGQILCFLCDHKDQELYQRDVEELFCIRRSTASHFLKALEQEGMILRQSVPRDARLKRLTPTERALGLHEEFRQKSRQLEEILSGGLTEEEVAQFLAVARKIRRNLSQ